MHRTKPCTHKASCRGEMNSPHFTHSARNIISSHVDYFFRQTDTVHRQIMFRLNIVAVFLLTTVAAQLEDSDWLENKMTTGKKSILTLTRSVMVFIF